MGERRPAWEPRAIPRGDTRLFCHTWISHSRAMNVVVTHTPIVSTLEMRRAYAPLAGYGANVFALDFSGTGRSGGREGDFSLASVSGDLDCLTGYIARRYPGPIHLYGTAGIGGMLAQHYAQRTDRIKSFAQFACADPRNTRPLGYPYPAVRALRALLRALPGFHVSMPPPPYTGCRAEADNGRYRELEAAHPDLWRASSKLLLAMLDCFAEAGTVPVPTLVFQTLHDRYFPPEYFAAYFDKLACEKRLVPVDDVHNSYYLDSPRFCREAYRWFLAHGGGDC